MILHTKYMVIFKKFVVNAVFDYIPKIYFIEILNSSSLKFETWFLLFYKCYHIFGFIFSFLQNN